METQKNGIFLLLGSNLGDKLQNLYTACENIEKKAGKILRQSSLYQSEPWGLFGQPRFYNRVLQIQSKLSPEDLLDCLLEIELGMGRERTEKWGPRLIDIDILYYNDRVCQSEKLTLPHPGIPYRRFTLMPLAEIAPSWVHPQLGLNQEELLLNCTDPLACVQIEEK